MKIKKTTFIQATVTKIDPENKLVHLEHHAPVEYDYAIVSLGFHSETFGIKGALANSLQMDDINSALKIHQHIVTEMKEYAQDHDENHLKIIVCGAGFTGVELLGSLHDMQKKYAKIAHISPDKIQIYCIDYSSVFLPMFSSKLSNYGRKFIDEWNIHLFLQCSINEVLPNEVRYVDNDGNEKSLVANTIIWTTGVSGSDVIKNSGYPEKRGRVHVNDDLTAPNDPTVYIIGDVAAYFPDNEKRPCPTTAQLAIAMGECATKNLIKELKDQSTQKFVYDSLGTIASLGKSVAFGKVFGLSLEGKLGVLAKKATFVKATYETGGLKAILHVS